MCTSFYFLYLFVPFPPLSIFSKKKLFYVLYKRMESNEAEFRILAQVRIFKRAEK